MQYDAVAVGKNDLAAGLSFLKDQSTNANFSWLSANLVRKADKKPIFPTSLIRRFEGLRIGIIGIIANDGEAGLQNNEDAVILPWQEVLPDLVADFSSRCDLIILLSNNSTSENQLIASSIKNIHLIIQSSPSSRNTEPYLMNKSLFTQTGKQGKYLGWMLIDWQKSKTWGKKGKAQELTVKKQELDGLNGRIRRIEKREIKETLAVNTNYQNLLA